MTMKAKTATRKPNESSNKILQETHVWDDVDDAEFVELASETPSFHIWVVVKSITDVVSDKHYTSILRAFSSKASAEKYAEAMRDEPGMKRDGAKTQFSIDIPIEDIYAVHGVLETELCN